MNWILNFHFGSNVSSGLFAFSLLLRGIGFYAMSVGIGAVIYCFYVDNPVFIDELKDNILYIVPGCIYLFCTSCVTEGYRLYNWVTDNLNPKISPVTNFLVNLEEKYLKDQAIEPDRNHCTQQDTKHIMFHSMVFSELTIVTFFIIAGLFKYFFMVSLLVVSPFILRHYLRIKRGYTKNDH